MAAVSTSSFRYFAEVTLPGVLIGLASGLLVGGATAIGGLPLWQSLLHGVGLGLPLAGLGAGYDLLLSSGMVRLGGITPAVLYWVPGWPLARLAHEGIVYLGLGGEFLPEALLPFLAYQAVVSIGYAIGFMWTHEFLAPLWWPRIMHHNPAAARYVSLYVKHAVAMENRKDADKPENAATRVKSDSRRLPRGNSKRKTRR